MDNFLSGIYKTLLKSVLGKYIFYIFQLITLVILARVLTPADFGTFALVNALFIMFIFIADMGLTPILVASEELDRKKLSQVFMINIFSGVVLAFVFYILCQLLIANKNINFLWHSLALVLFASTTIFSAQMIRNESFIKFGISESMSEISSLIIALALYYFDAIKAFDILFVKILSFYLVRTITMVVFSGVGLVAVGFPDIYYIFNMISKSFNQSKFNMSVCFSRNADNIFVGKWFGLDDLGFYDRAYNILKYPMLLVTFSIGPAVQPSLLKIANNGTLFEATVSKLINRLLAVSLLIMFFFCIYVEEIVFAILGEGWNDVAAILYIFGFSIPFQVIFGVFSGIYQSKGEYRRLSHLGLLSAALIVVSMVLSLIVKDLSMFAFFVSVSYVVAAVYGLVILYIKIMNVGWSSLLKYFGLMFTLYGVIVAIILAIGEML